jgi:hypothetical protein
MARNENLDNLTLGSITDKSSGSTYDIDALAGGGTMTDLANGNVVAVTNGSRTAVDPSGTSTPIQDALNICQSNSGGKVFLPPTSIDEGGTISMKSETMLLGFSVESTTINITPTGVPGIEFNSANNGSEWVRNATIDGFTLNGPGDGATTGPAIVHNGGSTENMHLGKVMVKNWHNAAYRVEGGNYPFQCRHDQFIIYSTDAGDTTNVGSSFSGGALIEYNAWAAGPANWWGTINAYPTTTSSGVASRILYMRAGSFHIENMNLGGSSGEVAAISTDADCIINRVNYEPGSNPSAETSLVTFCGNTGFHRLGSLRVTAGNAVCDYAVTVKSGDQAYDIGKVYIGGAEADGGTINNNIVQIASNVSAQSHEVVYEGLSSNVTDNSGATLSPGVSCLGDQTLVT